MPLLPFKTDSRWVPTWIAAGILLVFGAFGDDALAGNPRMDAMWNYSLPRPVYKVLPRIDYDGTTVPATPRPIYVGRPTQPYAYGWFGVPSYPQWRVHYNTPRAHAIWSRQP